MFTKLFTVDNFEVTFLIINVCLALKDRLQRMNLYQTKPF